MRTINNGLFLAAVACICLGQESLQAQYQIGQRVWVPPILGTYYSMQNTNWPPLPCLPLDVAVYSLAINGTEAYAYDDRDVNYSEMESSLQSGGPGTPDGPHWPSPDDYGPSDLWLSITNTHTNFVLVTLHNDPQYLYEQIQTKTDLVRQVEWTPGNDWPSFSATTNESYYLEPSTNGPMFFRTIVSSNVALVESYAHVYAVEPKSLASDPGTASYFEIGRGSLDMNTSLTVYYRMSGLAVNGVDYTNLSGSVTFGPNEDTKYIYVQPIEDNAFESDESVILTIIPTNTYTIYNNPYNLQSSTNYIQDNLDPNTLFHVIATNLSSPCGIDYHPLTDSIILSVNHTTSFPYDFVRFYSNANVTVRTNWSGVNNVSGEKKLTIVKATGNGFTNGDMFFGDGAFQKQSSGGNWRRLGHIRWWRVAGEFADKQTPRS